MIPVGFIGPREWLSVFRLIRGFQNFAWVFSGAALLGLTLLTACSHKAQASSVFLAITLLSVVLFFDPGYLILGLPISAGLGSILIYFLALDPHNSPFARSIFFWPPPKFPGVNQDPVSTLTEPKPEVFRRIEVLLRILRLEHAQEDAINKNLEKVSAGTMRHDQYQANVAFLQTGIDRLEREAQNLWLDWNARLMSHALLPRMNPWLLAGILGAAGFVLGLPWTLIYLHAQSQQSLGTFDFVLFDRFAAMLYQICRWPLYGLFFGFFYNFLRGDTGSKKALVLLVCIVVPWLSFDFLSANSLDWRTEVLYWAEFFIFFMALGMTADLYVVLGSGHGLRDLLEIGRLRPLVAWGTSLSVAIAIAASTALKSEATDLAKSFFPKEEPAQQTPLPKTSRIIVDHRESYLWEAADTGRPSSRGRKSTRMKQHGAAPPT